MRGDAVNPPGEPGTYDAVTSRYLMWTLREPDRTLVRWKQLLSSGGTLAIIDANWFPEGIHDSGHDMTDYYDSEVQRALPLAQKRTIDAIPAAVSDAGFVDVRVRQLDEIYRLDERYGVAPGHEIRMQYMITAKAP